MSASLRLRCRAVSGIMTQTDGDGGRREGEVAGKGEEDGERRTGKCRASATGRRRGRGRDSGREARGRGAVDICFAALVSPTVN